MTAQKKRIPIVPDSRNAQLQQCRQVVDGIPTLAWTARADGVIDWYNARWYDYTGTTEADMAGAGWQAVSDPAIRDRWQASIAAGQPFEMIVPLRGADGRVHEFNMRVSPFVDHEGQTARWLGINIDADTEQLARRASEQRTDDRLHAQFENLPVPTFLWEARGDDFVLLQCNEAARVEMPTLAAAGVGQSHYEIFPDRGEVRTEFRRSLRDDVVVRHSVETDLGQPFGRRRIDLTIGPQQPNRLLVHALDVTERMELEAQLRQARKMDTVGRLACGVAHDFNNLLTVIGAHSAFLLDSLSEHDPQREDADAIHQTTLRAAALTRQLLAFSRKQLLEPEVVYINGIVDQARRLLERLLGETISIVTHLTPNLPPILADPAQLDQVLVNLAVNARDAMPSGGTLTISTTREGAPEPQSHDTREVLAGDYVVLLVRDSGSGIDIETRARLFEPFFTTKEMGKGTGLGLATVYGIVKQSGGFIAIDDAPGTGTEFRIYFPVRSGEQTAQMQPAYGTAPRGHEAILLVEDESGVRTATRQMLERQGYVVLEAESGEAALTISSAYPSTIDLAISDVVMPGMGGAEVVWRLRAARPDIKTLFMSGYTDDEIIRQGIDSSAVPFVHKPFTLETLAHAVRAALDSTQ